MMWWSTKSAAAPSTAAILPAPRATPGPSKAKLGVAASVAAAIAIAVPLVGGFEGLRPHAYRDPVGVVTVCYGETKGVHMGDLHTVNECKDMLASRLVEFNSMVDKCIHVPMGPTRRASLISFTYNVGQGALCKSTFARKLNAGDPKACDELLKWTTAKGVALPGLLKRRQVERRMCETKD